MATTTRRAVIGGLCLVGAPPLFGLARKGHAQERRQRIAFANIDDASTFGASVLRGLKEAAARRGGIDLTAFDNRGDAARAVENARSVVAARHDLFIQYNGHAASNTPIVRMMSAAAIKALAVQVPVPGAPLFAVDNQASGTDSGRALAEEGKRRWPGVTPVAVVIGLPEAGPLFRDRGEAAKAAILAAYPGTAFEEFSSKGDVGYVRQTMTDLLTRYSGRKLLVWAHVDEVALAVVSAIRNTGRTGDAVVATTGGSPSVFPEIKRPGTPLLGTYSFFPELWGNDILDLAQKMLAGEAVPERSKPQRQLFVSAQNVAQFEAPK